jgi:fatty acid/phospholipid biosynthesis enzyme
MNLAVDAMGGDHAPEMVVQGAVDAVSEFGKALDTRSSTGPYIIPSLRR